MHHGSVIKKKKTARNMSSVAPLHRRMSKTVHKGSQRVFLKPKGGFVHLRY